MPIFTTIDEANAALLPYVPLVKQLTGKHLSLEARDKPFMRALGDPQNKLRVIHIAGTSGKTSTAYYMAALLRATGKRIGLTVSPHVDSVTERVQIDGEPVSDELFCRYLGEFIDIIDQQPIKPSYFTLLYAFAFWVFEKESVDYAVVETGLGGLLDSTNTANRSDKLCIITDIGLDHMHILGNTIREITAQKIGIVHKRNTVVMYQQNNDVSEVVNKWVKQQDATLLLTTEQAERDDYGADFGATMPEFQQRNWLLAHAAYRFLQDRDELPLPDDSALLKTQALQVPGRMDPRQVGGKIIIMDGAHNAQKIETFLRSFRQVYPGVQPAVLMALKEGKELASVAPLIAPIASEIIVTTFNTSQDLPAKSMKPQAVAEALELAGATMVRAEVEQHVAYEALLKCSSDVCIIIGSFYLLSQLRYTEHLA